MTAQAKRLIETRATQTLQETAYLLGFSEPTSFYCYFKATIIPSISICVSLLGTFAIVMLAGFSLNILTLFALVLAIGTVVDDAIVVVEAVMALQSEGPHSMLNSKH